METCFRQGRTSSSTPDCSRRGSVCGACPMRIGADASTGAVDATRDVSGTAPFTLAIDMTVVRAPYVAFQWLIEPDSAGLAVDGSASNVVPNVFDLCSGTYTLPGTFG